MSVPAAILGLLQASSDLVALVGTRIYPDVMDDPPVYPSVTFQKVGGGAARRALTSPGLTHATMQVSTWAQSRAEAVRIASAVRKALDRKRKITVAGVPVDDCFYEDDVDLYDPDVKVFFNHMSFTIHYREPA
jgi:hypothetical protein